jgi:hypothetical protein
LAKAQGASEIPFGLFIFAIATLAAHNIGDPIDGADNGGSAAIGILAKCGLDVRDGVGRMCEWEPELHAAGDPGSPRTNEPYLITLSR